VQKWQRHFVRRSNKVEYSLYNEASNRFLLSAVRVGDDIFISQHEDFAKRTLAEGQPPRALICAVLRKEVKGKHDLNVFRVYSYSCAGCDTVLQKYTCGFERAPPLQCERQMLVSVRHAKKKIPNTASEAHHIQVKLPALQSTAAHRCVWCPRTQPADNGGHVPPLADDEVIEAESQLPVWNVARRSLSLRFAEGRVKKASAKNFLMSIMKEGDGQEQRHGILQFGKCKKQTYVLDIRHPMSLVQGFAIALSTYGWKP